MADKSLTLTIASLAPGCKSLAEAVVKRVHAQQQQPQLQSSSKHHGSTSVPPLSSRPDLLDILSHWVKSEPSNSSPASSSSPSKQTPQGKKRKASNADTEESNNNSKSAKKQKHNDSNNTYVDWTAAIATSDKEEKAIISSISDSSLSSEKFCSLLDSFIFPPAPSSSTAAKKKRKPRRLSQHFLSTAVSLCLERDAWAPLATLLETGSVSAKSGIIARAVEQRRSAILSSCLRLISDVSERELVLILKYALAVKRGAVRDRSEDEADELKEKKKGDTEKKDEKKETEKEKRTTKGTKQRTRFIAHLLTQIFTYPKTDEFVISAMRDLLSTTQVTQLFAYLMNKLKQFLVPSSSSSSPVPSSSTSTTTAAASSKPQPPSTTQRKGEITLDQVVGWMSLLIDAHYTNLALSTALPLLEPLRKALTTEERRQRESLQLCGALAHMQEKKALPVPPLPVFSVEQLVL